MTHEAIKSEATTAEQLRAERAKRVADATELKHPDRVPVLLQFGACLAQSEGVLSKDLHENADTLGHALEKAVLRYQPDSYSVRRLFAPPSQILGEVMTKWPGYQLEPNGTFQYHEQEYMKAEDYDAFIADPADWSFRTYLPRIYTKLQGLSKLPHLAMASLGFYSLNSFLASIEDEEVAVGLEALAKSAKALAAWSKQLNTHIKRIATLGFPALPAGIGNLHAPFDFMADTLRGTKGIFIDMRRNPDKLLAAQEKVIQIQVDYALARSKATGNRFVNIPLHRGSDGFMSQAQFDRFYWPQFKELMVRLVEAGISPKVFYEGNWDHRIDYLTQLPKGTFGRFQKSNLFKVKEILGNSMCISGGMPVTMLLDTDPSELREYTHKICQEVGKGGGFIMTTDIPEMEGCKPELIGVWVDAVKEFGGV